MSILSRSNSRSQYRRKIITSSRFHWRGSCPKPPGSWDLNWVSKGEGGGCARKGLGYLHSKSGVNGSPEGREMGGTFMLSLLFESWLFWLAAAAAAAVRRAAMRWAASTEVPPPVAPCPPPPAWAAATSASKSGRGFKSCEKIEVGVCCKWEKNQVKIWIMSLIFKRQQASPALALF